MDVDFENEKVSQMDNVVQEYTAAEDDIITSALNLFAGLEMKDAINFKKFKPIFSTTKYLKGCYNSSLGDIYVKSIYTVRGDHSRVAARIANYHCRCYNPGKNLRPRYSS